MKSKVERKSKNISKSIYQEIVEQIYDAVHWPVSIWVKDQAQDGLIIKTAIGLSNKYIKKASLKLNETSATGEAFRTGKIIEIYDILNDKRWKYKKDAEEMGWCSALCVPIESNHKVIGVISVYSNTPHSFSEMEKHLLLHYASSLELNLGTQQMKRSLDRLLILGQKVEEKIAQSPKIVYDEIVSGFKDVTGADCVVLYPYDYMRQNFYDLDQVAALGLTTGMHISDKPRPRSGTAAQVAARGELIVNDISRGHARLARSPFVKREHIRAFYGISLKLANRNLGVIYINYREPHFFTKNEINIIRIFAHQAAIAISNTNLYREMGDRADALNQLNKVAPKLVSISNLSQSLRDVLTQIAKNALTVLNADIIGLYQYYQGRDHYDLPPIQVGIQISRPVRKNTVHPDDVVCSIVNQRKPKYSDDAQSDETLSQRFKRKDAPKKRFVFRENLKSVAAVPLLVDSEIVGVLFVNYRQQQTFPQQQRELIELFAAQAAIAIKNARKVHALDVIQKFGRELTSGMRKNEAEILELIRDQAKELMDTNNMYIALYEPDPGKPDEDQLSKSGPRKVHGTVRFGLAYRNGEKIDIKTDPQWQERKAGTGRTEEIIRTQKLILHSTKAKALSWYAKPKHHASVKAISASWLGVPMTTEGKALGVIAIYHPSRNNVFDQEDVEILQAIANQAAIALDNAHMYYDKNKKLAELVQFGQSLTSGIRLTEQEILDNIYIQTSKLMDTANMYIAAYEPDPSQIDEFNPDNPSKCKIHGTVSFKLAYINNKHVDIEKEKGWQPRKAGSGRTEQIIRTRQYLFHPSREETQAWYRAEGRKDYLPKTTSSSSSPFASFIGVPMIVSGKVWGVIAVYHPADYVYDEDDLTVLKGITEYASIALENHSMLHGRLQELETTQAIASQIASENNLEALLLKVLEQAKNIVNADDAIVYRYDPDLGEFYNNVKIKELTYEPNPGRGGTPEAVVKHGEIIFAENAKAHPVVSLGTFVRRQGIKSSVAAPLMVGRKCVGVLFVNFRSTHHHFTPDEKRILSILASQAASAIQNVGGLHDMERQHKAALKSIQAVRECRTLGELLNTYLEFVITELEASSGTIQLLDQTTQILTVRASSGIVSRREFESMDISEGVTGEAAKKQRMVYVRDVKETQYPYRGFFESRSELAVPLMENNRVFGVLNVEHVNPGAFDVYKRRLCELFAEHASPLIHERMELEAAHQAEKDALSVEMMQDTAHHIKNFLGSARVHLNHVRLASQLPPPLMDKVEQVDKNLLRSVEIAEALFKPYRPGQKGEHAVGLLLQEAISMLGRPTNMKIDLTVQNKLPKVWIEAKNTVDFFHEILTNGVKYVQKRFAKSDGDQGYIKVTGRRSRDGKVEILFTNNGISIPEANWKNTFKKFWRDPSQQDGDSNSFGLGLWGAYTFFQRQGGEIYILESNDDRTTFVVRLPIKPVKSGD
jgi:GAF domain-containing protein